MAGLKNHPGMWLNDVAAAAFNAFEDKYGVIQVNSAGRTEAEQQGLINRWDRGGKYNRPPYLYQPARPARTSPHVRNGGAAVDIRDYNTWKDELAEFGFNWYGPGDVVHFNHNGDRRWLEQGGPAEGFSQTVANEQNFLNVARGEQLQVDGLRGPKTIAAYKRYQEYLRSRGWYSGAIDGIWGGGTQAGHTNFYNEWAAAQNSARPSSKSAGELNYADIQTALNRHGYNLAVDNVWGPKSSAALADFQSKNGLVVDRLVGPKTWDKLNR